MKCMLLAAGLGERLRPITDKIPKPLVKVAGKPLIEYHLENLRSAGFKEVVINLSHFGEMIQEQLGDGTKYDIEIMYSQEGPQPLETAGGIINALPLLGDKPFLVINADIWCNHSLSIANLSSNKQAHLVLVDNPKHNLNGDFAYEFGKVYNTGNNFLTFSGIGIYDPKLFEHQNTGKLALAPILRNSIDKGLVSAEYFTGKWFDIGTQERLAEADTFVSTALGRH
ncbi:MAG: N-acetylmuramate alpha-1-phosphate uridylyltransferase MurU [Gammaproteobacteria bacterium]